ncbi:MAG: prolyl oligopeptidase family serine peptidase, partial [Myxococcales bacterium]|nr:prolyl oligopeptidase family serine peptidase [Myxococcales bacterium]
YGIYDFADRNGVTHKIGMDKLFERQIMKGSRDEIPDAYERASPIARVHPAAPPFMVIHGTRDSLASLADARHFVEALRKTSRAPTVHVELPGAQHAFEIFHSPRALHAIHGVARFLAWARSRYLAEREG